MLLLLALHLTIYFLTFFHLPYILFKYLKKSEYNEFKVSKTYIALCIVVPTDIYHARTKKAMVNYSALKLELS